MIATAKLATIIVTVLHNIILVIAQLVIIHVIAVLAKVALHVAVT